MSNLITRLSYYKLEKSKNEKNKIIVSILLLILSISYSFSQSQDKFSVKTMYKKAYKYIKSSSHTKKYANSIFYYANHCKKIDSFFINAKIDTNNLKIHISKDITKASIWDCMCDYLSDKYNIKSKKDCRELIRLESSLISHINDSISNSHKKIALLKEYSIIKKLSSKKQDGFILFFSALNGNHLIAELKYFCVQYGKDIWMGTSQIFYLIFNKDDEIEKVYLGYKNYN